MADDLKYGYKGAEPTQSFGNNTGVFDPNDINNLIADNKWTTFGQLELIETQSITSATTYMDFINLANTNYNVHFLTLNNAIPSASNPSLRLQLSTDNGSSFIGGTSYQRAGQYNDTNQNGESRTTTSDGIYPLVNVSDTTNGAGNGYVYLYNFLDSSKYSFITWHSSSLTGSSIGYLRSWFGSGVLPTSATHNAFRIQFYSGNINNLQASLYGIRYS